MSKALEPQYIVNLFKNDYVNQSLISHLGELSDSFKFEKGKLVFILSLFPQFKSLSENTLKINFEELAET
jgi:hypothetical protein